MRVGEYPDVPRDEFPVRLDIRAWVSPENGTWVARIAGLPELKVAETTPERAVRAIERMANQFFLESPREVRKKRG